MNAVHFLHPAFLLGLSVLAIPVILHLINRKISKPLIFPSIKFINLAQDHPAGKKRIRDWLVLLTRMLLLAIIVFLFSFPVILENPLALNKSRDEIVLFYDLSASMNNNEFNAFVETETEQILADNPEASFALIASSNKVEKFIPANSSQLDILNSIKELKPTHIPGDHYSALLEIKKILNSESKASRNVFLFSDLQQYDWSPAKIPDMHLNATINFIKPKHSGGTNLAILKVTPEIFIKGSARRLRATVQVHNFSITPAAARLKLKAGNAVTSRDITLGGELTEKFVVDLENPASNTAVASIETTESYVLDNDYYFWIGPLAPQKVAIIADTPSKSIKSIETFFLRNALAVTIPGTNSYDVDVVTPDYIWDHSLKPFSTVFIIDSISDYSDAEMEVLSSYLAEGGTLVYFCGKKTADSMAMFNHADISRVRFLGYHGEINQLRSYSLDRMLKGSPVISIFEEEQSDLFHFPIYKAANLSPSADASVLLTMQGNYPFLIQDEYKKGVLFIISTSLSPNWSELSTSMTFLPLIRQITAYGSRGKKSGVVEFSIGEINHEQLTELDLPDNIELDDNPGIQLIENIPVELNITRRESDLRAVEEYDISGRISSKNRFQGKDNDPRSVTAGRYQSLKEPVAWGLICFFFCELILANRKVKS